MFTYIYFLNIKLLLKIEKLKTILFFYLKLCIFCTELYILNKAEQKKQASTSNNKLPKHV